MTSIAPSAHRASDGNRPTAKLRARIRALAFFSPVGLALLAAGCSSDSSTPSADAGLSDAGGLDASGPDDSGTRPDSGARDAGSRDAQPRPDAGYYCAENEAISVSGTTVHVGQASATSETATGGAANTICTLPPPGLYTDPMFIRGCLAVAGVAPTAAERAQLDVAVFRANLDDGTPVDPTFDSSTWADRMPAGKMHVSVALADVPPGVCSSGVQLTVGYNDAAENALGTETEYVIRVRTATSGAAVWATEYFPGFVARNDNVTKTGRDCTTQSCYLRYDLTLVRASSLAAYVGQAPTALPGASDLTDGLGAGYALVRLLDCGNQPMRYAVAGSNPSPLADGYLTAGALALGATETSTDGQYLALGFAGQTATSSTAIPVTFGVATNRDGVCTEAYAGATLLIYPDAITVFQSGRASVLHSR